MRQVRNPLHGMHVESHLWEGLIELQLAATEVDAEVARASVEKRARCQLAAIKSTTGVMVQAHIGVGLSGEGAPRDDAGAPALCSLHTPQPSCLPARSSD
jgi:hypothetical protein